MTCSDSRTCSISRSTRYEGDDDDDDDDDDSLDEEDRNAGDSNDSRGRMPFPRDGVCEDEYAEEEDEELKPFEVMGLSSSLLSSRSAKMFFTSFISTGDRARHCTGTRGKETKNRTEDMSKSR